MTARPDAVGGEARAGGLPEIIHLPDQSQPPPEKKRGRHFGAHRVKDPRIGAHPSARDAGAARGDADRGE